MRRGIAGLLTFFCLIIVGCSDKNSVPSGILPVDKMYPILWDMIEADQYAALLAKDSAHIDMKLEHLRLYEQVLQTYDVSRAKFEKSYNYYKEHPEINQILFDSLAAQGGRLRTEVYAHPGSNPSMAIPPARVPPPGIQPPGRPGMPVIRPFIKPNMDSIHRKRHIGL